jgi:hypothetical protein
MSKESVVFISEKASNLCLIVEPMDYADKVRLSRVKGKRVYFRPAYRRLRYVGGRDGLLSNKGRMEVIMVGVLKLDPVKDAEVVEFVRNHSFFMKEVADPDMHTINKGIFERSDEWLNKKIGEGQAIGSNVVQQGAAQSPGKESNVPTPLAQELLAKGPVKVPGRRAKQAVAA